MTVHFIGAGPGAPDLITVRGLKLIQSCPVCLYAGSLVPEEIVKAAPPGARVVDTAPLTLEDIVAEIEAALASVAEVEPALDEIKAFTADAKAVEEVGRIETPAFDAEVLISRIAALEQVYRDIAEGRAANATRSDAVTTTSRADTVYSLKMMGGVVQSTGIGVVRINSDILSFANKRQVKLPLLPPLAARRCQSST